MSGNSGAPDRAAEEASVPAFPGVMATCAQAGDLHGAPELCAHLPFPWGQGRGLLPPEKGNAMMFQELLKPSPSGIDRPQHPQSLRPQSSPGEDAGGREQHRANLTVLETEA